METTLADIRTHRLDNAAEWQLDAFTAAIPIAELTPEHRLHLAASMVDGAKMHAAAYALYFDRIVGRPCPPVGNPLAWMKERPLFKALVRELPHKRNTLRPLAERTRHEVGCNAPASCCCDLTAPISPATIGIIEDAARLAKSVTV